ncbi:MAG: recombinase [Robiginitomaculum sp.]|nr:MAG: recombinase [Robiginitomaculum sp.]
MSNNNTKLPSHTVDDHMFGDFYAHEHEGDSDHDHDDMDPGPLEDNPIWQRDNVALTSVGIDIGSAGTQVIFSNIHLQRKSDSLASRYIIVDRKTVYESPVSFTPYSDEVTIDGAALGVIIDDAYHSAGIRPRDIDTGVVILTGEALRRENAAAIAQVISEKGGDFVTATAGNHMEAMLAAYGSGAAKASHDQKCRILNIDIGGGTTKLALADCGQIVWTAAFHIGGRLIATENGLVTRLDPAGAHHARQVGIDLSVGAPIDALGMAKISTHLAKLIVGAVTLTPPTDEIRRLFLTDLPTDFNDIKGIMFSGGVGEYVARREERDFGDLGKVLGHELRRRVDNGDLNAPFLAAAACMRATALGASEYSVQLSGQTSTITAPGTVLPRRSMQVLKPNLDLSTHPSTREIAQSILHHFEAFDLDPETAEVALAFEFHVAPEYRLIRTLADGIVSALGKYLASGRSLYVMIDGDIAQTLGGILQDEISLSNELLILDGISLRDFDYIDLGKVRLPSFTVPVTIKSLLFSEDPNGPQRQERIHFHEHGSEQHTHSHKHV